LHHYMMENGLFQGINYKSTEKLINIELNQRRGIL